MIKNNIKEQMLIIICMILFCCLITENYYSQTPTVSSNRFKRIDYNYDLISGKVNEVHYQDGQADAFHHHYEYDSDNRITEVYTSKAANAVWTGIQDDPFWEKDAKYFYYAHGPLARVEYGSNSVQGVDYAYTLQGWIKGVNSNTLKTNRDMGKDGDPLTPNANGIFAKDAFGYTLNYYKGDYRAIDNTKWNNPVDRFEAVTTGSDLMNSRYDLYNGNITSMATTIVKPTLTATGDTLQFVPLPQGTAYRYDQLNRLKEMKAWQNLNVTSNTWGTGLTYNGMYNNKFTYDANGSMLTALAKNQAGQIIDNQTYHHQTLAGKKLRNRTYAITDVATQTSGNDLLDQIAFNNTATTINNINNYSYTEIGERKSNKQDSIDLITWTVYGKIKEVKRSNGCNKYNLKFDYDASGNRVAKHLFKSDGTTWVKSEYYVKDAQGNIMSTYEYEATGATPPISYARTESHIYGSNSIGIDETKTEMIASIIDNTHYINVLGNKLFNGSNHLGNVLISFTDRKLQVDLNGDNITDEYWPHVVSSNDYAPFGGLLTERTFKKGAFQNSYNGKRDDAELNVQDYGMRVYNPQERELGWMVDPEGNAFAWNSPYTYAENRPIDGFDQDGLEYMNIHTFEMLKRTDPFKHFIVSALIKMKSPDMKTVEYKGMQYYNVGMHIFNKEGMKLTEWVYTKKSNVLGDTYNSWGSSGEDCLKACKKDIEEKGFTLSKNGAIRLFSGGKKSASSVEKAVDLINSSLEEGRPVIIGVDGRSKKDYKENAGFDKTVDHYIVVTGRDFIDGKQVFTFIDNAMGNKTNETDPKLNYFEVTEGGDILFGKSYYKSQSKVLDQFEMKVVRPTEKKTDK